MNNHEPKFDGEKWRCARCLSVLATVAQVEELQLPTRERPTMESKRVTVLELPAGYVKPKGRDEYVKPNKTHPFMRGAGQQKDRIKRVGSPSGSWKPRARSQITKALAKPNENLLNTRRLLPRHQNRTRTCDQKDFTQMSCRCAFSARSPVARLFRA